MTTALIYVRQSRTDDRSLSLQIQEDACRKLPDVAACAKVEVVRDEDISGRKSRKKFDAVMEKIRDGGVDVVAFYDQSRAFRSSAIAVTFKALMSEPRYAHIPVLYAVGGGRFDRTPVGGFSYTVVAAAHQMEAEMTGEKIKANKRAVNASGRVSGYAPYGYRFYGALLTPDGRPSAANGTIEPDSETAPVVRRIFEMYADGASTKQIAQQLDVEGVAAPKRTKNPTKEQPAAGWLKDTIGGYLSNISYVGQTWSGSKAKREGQIIPASWPAIIPDGLFKRVQDRLANHKVPVDRGGPKRKREFVFRGLLWCTECERRFAAVHSHGINYYNCGSADTSQPCQHANAIREEKLLPWVDNLITGFEQGKMSGLRFGKKPLMAKETAEDALRNIEGQIKRLDIRFAHGTVNEAEFATELRRLREQRAIYAAQAAEEPKPAELEGIADRWRKGDAGQRWELLNALFEKLHVKDREIVGYTPRGDRANRVRLLLNTAWDYLDPDSVEARDDAISEANFADGPGAAPVSGISGKGGIRTLEGVSHPLPA